jgi:hypothetical protein
VNKFVTLVHSSNAKMENNFIGINLWREKIIFIFNMFKKILYHKDKDKNEIIPLIYGTGVQSFSKI